MSQSEVARIEAGASPALSVVTATRITAAIGLDLAVRVYPGGPPIRDIGQLKLLARLRTEIHPSLRWRTEVPLPIAGDQRAFDVVVDGPGVRVAIECVSRLMDAQATERDVNRKLRDGGMACAVLVLKASRHNRAALAGAGALREAFPLSGRAVLAALRAGRQPGGNGIVLI